MCNPEDLVKLLPKEAVTELALPASKATGQTLAIIPRAIKAAFFPLEKWILYREFSLIEIEKLLAIKLQNIPAEKIVTPEPYVAVPALQAISYCMDSEDLRELFANLLATSMNIDTKANAHPAFVEIIKQFSPIDAKVIKFLGHNKTSLCPLCHIRQQKISNQLSIITQGFEISPHPFRSSTEGYDVLRNFVIMDDISTDSIALGSSMDNLNRLGIIDIKDNYILSDAAFYLPFINHPTSQQCIQEFNKIKEKQDEHKDREIVLLRTSLAITNLGRSLCNAIL